MRMSGSPRRGVGMDLQLGRQVVIVTGAASGIGAAAARCLSAEGVGGLVLSDRDATGLARLQAELSPETPVETARADLADPAAARTIAATCIPRIAPMLSISCALRPMLPRP